MREQTMPTRSHHESTGSTVKCRPGATAVSEERDWCPGREGPICEPAAWRSVGSDAPLRPGTWAIWRCEGCGAVSLSPRPTPTAIARAYVSYYRHADLRRDRELLGHIRCLPAPAGGRLLDVGCGDGGYLSRTRSLGWTTTSVERDPTAAQRGRDAARRLLRRNRRLRTGELGASRGRRSAGPPAPDPPSAPSRCSLEHSQLRDSDQAEEVTLLATR